MVILSFRDNVQYFTGSRCFLQKESKIAGLLSYQTMLLDISFGFNHEASHMPGVDSFQHQCPTWSLHSPASWEGWGRILLPYPPFPLALALFFHLAEGNWIHRCHTKVSLGISIYNLPCCKPRETHGKGKGSTHSGDKCCMWRCTYLIICDSLARRQRWINS